VQQSSSHSLHVHPRALRTRRTICLQCIRRGGPEIRYAHQAGGPRVDVIKTRTPVTRTHKRTAEVFGRSVIRSIYNTGMSKYFSISWWRHQTRRRRRWRSLIHNDDARRLCILYAVEDTSRNDTTAFSANPICSHHKKGTTVGEGEGAAGCCVIAVWEMRFYTTRAIPVLKTWVLLV